MMRALCTTLTCALWILLSTGCLEGYNSNGTSTSLPSQSADGSAGGASNANSPYNVSGNGEGYGGIVSGNYYAFTPIMCDRLINNIGRNPAYLKSILDKNQTQGVLTTDLCQQMPSQSDVADSSLFSATHNSNILLLSNGDVFERHASETDAGNAQQIEMFCRGKRVYYGGDNGSFNGVHYQLGVTGFRAGPVRDELFVDFVVRHKRNPTYNGGLLEDQYDGELVFETQDTMGNININVLKDFNVDHWIRSNNSSDFLSEFGVLGVDPSVNTGNIFFEGKMTLNLPGIGMVQSDMVCTKAIK